MPLDRRYYQIIDLDFTIESDCPLFWDLFDQDYRWFRSESQGKAPLVCQFDAIQKRLVVGEEIYSLDHYANPYRHAFHILRQALLERFPHFLLLHAGVVERNGGALVVSGHCGTGKTTMVLGLLEEGFHFFSDDFCPIHRETKLVYPFPRSLWLVHSEATEVASASLRKNKIPLLAPQIGAQIGHEPCPMRCLVHLDPGYVEPFYDIRIFFHGDSEAFLNDLQRLPQIQIERPEGREWHLVYPKKEAISHEVKLLLKKYASQISSSYRVDRFTPDFNRTPGLVSIPTHEAVFHLIQGLKQETALNEGQEAPGKFFVDLSTLLAGIPCYRLTVGHREAMRDCVLKAFDGA